MKRYYPLLVIIIIIGGMFVYVMKGKGSNASTIAAAPSPNSSVPAQSTNSTAVTGPTPTPAATNGLGLTDGTHTGQTVSTDYGDVQVELVVSGGKITSVNVLKQPAYDRRSEEINAQAIPMLKSEVLSAQSANIDSISGASFTSDGFIQSLQSAFSS